MYWDIKEFRKLFIQICYSMETMIILYITCKDKEEAMKIAKQLLSQKLAACVNFFPIESMYLWNATVEYSQEYVLLVKTENNKYKQIEKEIKKVHSYECPCIIKFNAQCNKEYQQWLQTAMR
jgi:periplasmic divalent cation tolerance protein